MFLKGKVWVTNWSRSNFFSRSSVTSLGTSSLLFQPVCKLGLVLRASLHAILTFYGVIFVSLLLCILNIPQLSHSQHTSELYFSHLRNYGSQTPSWFLCLLPAVPHFCVAQNHRENRLPCTLSGSSPFDSLASSPYVGLYSSTLPFQL